MCCTSADQSGPAHCVWLCSLCLTRPCKPVGTNRANRRCFADDGPKAAAWLAQQCAAFPVLRPLCLALRGLLAEQRLADAATGGLR